MTPRVHLERDGGIAVIVIDNPPINAGSAAVRQGLMAAVETLRNDDTLEGAVLIGAGSTFIAGSDLREFGQPLTEPQLPTVIAAIEACGKPVVAALHGAALGGGFELALGCDARVAAPGTVVGLPEVTLGIMPGAGGTQNLPRAVGGRRAKEILLTGRPFSVQQAFDWGMVNRICKPETLVAEALETAAVIAGTVVVTPPLVAARETACAKSALIRFRAPRASAVRSADCVEALAECSELTTTTSRIPVKIEEIMIAIRVSASENPLSPPAAKARRRSSRSWLVIGRPG